MKYVVYGYYSSAEAGQTPSWLGEYDTRDEAWSAVQEFQEVVGRYAWIEVE